MRKLIVIAILCAFSVMLLADAKDEALSSMGTAKDLINSGDYKKAADELNYALTKINELLSQNLVKYLPQAPAGYTEESREATSLGSAGAILGSANSLAATSSYSASSGSSISVTISVGGMMGQVAGFASMGQMWGGATTGSSSVRIKGYTGTLEYDKDDQSGTLSVKVGDETSVIVEGSMISDGEVLKQLVNGMDLSGLEKEF